MKLQKNVKIHSDNQIIRATRRLKAQTSYFSTRIFLGTIVVPMVPKKYNFQFKTKINEKQTHLTHKWHCTTTHGTPMVPKILWCKSMISRLSNALSAVFIRLLVIFLDFHEIWLHIFKFSKIKVFTLKPTNTESS